MVYVGELSQCLCSQCF